MPVLRPMIRQWIGWFSALLPALAIGGHCHAQSVLSYHGSADRSGNFLVPALNWERARLLHLNPSFQPQFAGHLYAQPLFWRPPGSASGVLIVATENDEVHAIDAKSGSQLWTRSLGRPVALSTQPCGNIDPLGITGTPVIDEATQTVYLAAMVGDASGAHHRVFALSLKDGAPIPGWPIDVAEALAGRGQHFNTRFQNQRGALAILGGRVYVPYGGHYGDCGDYHGLVLALGKDARAYLLDGNNLGGIGGSLASKIVSTRSIRTAPAAYPAGGGVFVAFQGQGENCPTRVGGNLTVLHIRAGSPPSLDTAWCGAFKGEGSPIVTTTDGRANPIVWVVGAEGDGLLHGYRGDTGEPLFTGGGPANEITGLRHFQTLLAAGERLYVGAEGSI